MGIESALGGGGIAAPIIGALIGAQQSQSQLSAARRARARALAEFAGLDTPSIEAQLLNLQLPEIVGEYAPQTEQFIELGPSSMEGLSTDPRLQQAQMAALEQIAQLSKSGLSEADISGLELARRGAASEAQAKQGQILQEMQARGQGGSGAELIARLKASQSGADRLSQEGLDINKLAQQRALQALSQQGTLAGQLRQQSFGEQSDIARAKDLVNQFNIQQQQGLQQRNLSAQNQAALRNLQERQRIAEQQAAYRNYQDEKNKALQQQQFQNQLNLASGRAGQYGNVASAADRRAADIAQMWTGIGQGVGQGLAGATMAAAPVPTAPTTASYSATPTTITPQGQYRAF